MGIFAQIIGTLGMFAGVVAAAFGFTMVGTGGFLLLPYGIGLFVSGMLIVCLGLIVEHVHGLRKAAERQIEIFEAIRAKKV
ncbi:hypothetical protein KUG47_12940 [Falsochrobactrum sp. TDYN1]|uniref:Uncharacterized protein n=1 Tax=Falsochrobactrum tianjinense TaxID=2706015 RepID=A0A949PQ71_9HYPH|nr:hypothetical protein [Falsochrobactrum sp. TDYN1]MBV2144400.1 hypothetical protein [Falsochrobactrum sp. TDYN1]